jgi:hypothetical protein
MITVCLTGLICAFGMLFYYKIPASTYYTPTFLLPEFTGLSISGLSLPSTSYNQNNFKNITKLISQEIGFIFYITGRKNENKLIPWWGEIQKNVLLYTALENINTSL